MSKFKNGDVVELISSTILSDRENIPLYTPLRVRDASTPGLIRLAGYAYLYSEAIFTLSKALTPVMEKEEEEWQVGGYIESLVTRHGNSKCYPNRSVFRIKTIHTPNMVETIEPFDSRFPEVGFYFDKSSCRWLGMGNPVVTTPPLPPPTPPPPSILPKYPESLTNYQKRKFKPGDVVVGNKEASLYGITNEGWKGVVILNQEGNMIVVKKFGTPYDDGSNSYAVQETAFDLLIRSYDNVTIPTRPATNILLPKNTPVVGSDYVQTPIIIKKPKKPKLIIV